MINYPSNAGELQALVEQPVKAQLDSDLAYGWWEP